MTKGDERYYRMLQSRLFRLTADFRADSFGTQASCDVYLVLAFIEA